MLPCHVLHINMVRCEHAALDVCVHPASDASVHTASDVCMHAASDVCLHFASDVCVLSDMCMRAISGVCVHAASGVCMHATMGAFVCACLMGGCVPAWCLQLHIKRLRITLEIWAETMAHVTLGKRLRRHEGGRTHVDYLQDCLVGEV